MRIHIYTLRLKDRGGGSHQNLLVFTRFLMHAGHDVAVHALFSEGNDPPSDIALQRERGDGRSFLDLQRFCARVMQRDQESADVMLVYGQALLWAGGMYRREGGRVPVAVYLDSHLDSMPESHRERGVAYRIKHLLWERTIGRLYARSVDRYLAVSPYLVERFARARFPKEMFSVIPNAFDFSEAPQLVSHDVPRILSVGRLSYEKGPDILLEALSQIKEDSWDARFVGDGAMRETLETMIRSYGLQERVHIVGWKDPSTLSEEFAAADIVVLPSRVPEPFGRTVVEAMRAGVPVVVPEIGGAAWVAGDAAVTFENGDVDSLAKTIEKLLEDDALRSTLREGGIRRASDFDVSVVGPTLERALVSLARA